MKLLAFLNKPLVGGILKSLPLGVGSIAQNFLSKEGGVGKADTKELPAQLLKILIYVVLLYMVFNGKIDFSEAEQYKEFIED